MDEFVNEFKIAKSIAERAHEGQKDKIDEDYVLHPLAVSELCSTPRAKIVALLHDVVGDGGVTLNDLCGEGISIINVEAVDCLTRRKDEKVDDYFGRIAANVLAIEVKIADLLHNASYERFPKTFDREEAKKIVMRYSGRMKLLFEKAGKNVRHLSLKLYDEAKKKIEMYNAMNNETLEEDAKKEINFKMAVYGNSELFRVYIFLFEPEGKLLGYYDVEIDKNFSIIVYISVGVSGEPLRRVLKNNTANVNRVQSAAIDVIAADLDVQKINTDRYYIVMSETDKAERVLSLKRR